MAVQYAVAMGIRVIAIDVGQDKLVCACVRVRCCVG